MAIPKLYLLLLPFPPLPPEHGAVSPLGSMSDGAGMEVQLEEEVSAAGRGGESKETLVRLSGEKEEVVS